MVAIPGCDTRNVAQIKCACAVTWLLAVIRGIVYIAQAISVSGEGMLFRFPCVYFLKSIVLHCIIY
jgi:hypothetical protein